MTLNRKGKLITVFVSHKAKDREIARKLTTILHHQMTGLQFFLSEDITKGSEWRHEIKKALDSSSALILIYTDPTDDWSWCLYEVGYFASRKKSIFCLHNPAVEPPDPLIDRQTIPATEEEVVSWLTEFYRLTAQSAAYRTMGAAASEIARLLCNHNPVLDESVVRPAFTILPLWPDEQPVNWKQTELLTPLPLAKSPVVIDKTSAILLGFSEPRKFSLADFLDKLDDEETTNSTWINQFMDSVDATLRGSIYDQQITTFRHKNGRILRPIIDSVSCARDGSYCECHAVFVDAFSAPPGTQHDPLQLLANGIRLATRFRIEVLNKYLNRMRSLHSARVIEVGNQDSISQKFPIGSRLIEATELIIQEAQTHSLNWQDDPPRLFDSEVDQREYEQIRRQFQDLYPALKKATKEEDGQGSPNYTIINEFLKQLDLLNRSYMALALPRFGNFFREPSADVE